MITRVHESLRTSKASFSVCTQDLEFDASMMTQDTYFLQLLQTIIFTLPASPHKEGCNRLSWLPLHDIKTLQRIS